MVEVDSPVLVGGPHVIHVDMVLMISSRSNENRDETQNLVGCNGFPFFAVPSRAVQIGTDNNLIDNFRR